MYYISESLSQWLLVTFSTERIIAIYFPLKAKSILTFKFTISMIITALMFSTVASIPAFFAFDINLTDSDNGFCFTREDSQVLNYIMVFFTIAQKYPISTAIIVSQCFWIGIKLVLISRERVRNHNLNLGISENVNNKKEFNAGIVLLLLGSVHGTIYVINSLAWETILLDRIFHFLSSDVLNFLYVQGMMADVLTIFIRLWNFYVYMARIPTFRHVVLKQCRLQS